MQRNGHGLPHAGGADWLTDGGLETTLVFHHGMDLPCFAAFPLLFTREGRDTLDAYFRDYLALARRHGTGMVLDTPTWRANPDWAAKLGYGPGDLPAVNRAAVEYAGTLRAAHSGQPIVINGVLGPRGDGYVAGEAMTAAEAEAYHGPQVRDFAESGADMVSAITMTSAEEAIGIARAARSADIPAVISFTVETDGRLPSGERLREAIERTDTASGGHPAYYMINCAHPAHFDSALAEGGAWLDRLGGLRANASRMSHAELDAATELDAGDPEDLAVRYRDLRARLRNLRVFGGCCGTDHRHVAAICAACL